MFTRFALTLLLIGFIGTLMAQNVIIEGYVFEDGNRGYLNEAKVTIIEKATGMEKGVANSDNTGKFVSAVPINGEYIALVEKDLFTMGEHEFSTIGKKEGEKVFLKFRMVRKPGYIFDVSLAEKRIDVDIPVDAIRGAHVEVYNNTQDEQILDLKDYNDQSFKVHFEDGNHYTILIRKSGFFNKRMEAFVNVKGCILCFEGVGEVKPSDVLSEGNTMGTLVANVELDRIKMNEGWKLENIYYEYASAKLTDGAKYELDKLINLLSNNPSLIAELGSHTDARGDDDYNYELSGRRASTAVDYVIANSVLDRIRIKPAGYGESTPTNKCKNGVDCTEAQHAVNRRTELKIVGRLSVDPFEKKSLADIIADEKMEELLAEIMSADAVRVADGEEIPDEIRKELENEDKDRGRIEEEEIAGMDAEPEPPVKEPIVEEAIEKVVEVKETIKAKEITEVVEEVVEIPVETKIVEEVAIDTRDPGETMLEEMDRVEEQVKVDVPPAPIEAPIIETPIIEEEVVVEEVIAELPAVVEEKIFETEVIEIPQAGSQSGPSTTSSQIFKEYEISTPKPYRQAKKMETGYSGYRVELIQSAAELPGSHEIFYRHGNVVYDQNKDGSYSYMLGSFQEAKDAQDFLQNIILAQYPAAKVVRYKKGNRING